MAGPRAAVARHADEQELAEGLGAEFGLGALEGIAQLRPVHPYQTVGCVLGVLTAFAGGAVVASVAWAQYPLEPKVITAAVVAALFAGCCALFSAGRKRTVVTRRQFRYSGGLAQVTTGEPEPKIAGWADVTAVTVFYAQVEDEAPRLDGLAVSTAAGAHLSALPGFRRRGELRALVAAAERNVGPRLLAALSEAYDEGEEVSFGRVRLSRDGITVGGYPPAGQLIAWTEVKSVHMTSINPAEGDYVDDIVIGRRGTASETVYAGGLTNGIFLPALLARAAAREGVVVTGYRAGGGGVPAR
jgi:hypothetical protein